VIIIVKQRQVWVREYSDLAKQRIHNRECPACGKPKSEWTRRTDWTCCSKKCSEKFYNEEQSVKSWDTTKKQAFKRDDYTCVWCGKRFVKKYSHLDLKDKEFADTSKLIGDHITPIAVGGDEFNVDNVQTLCIDCNKIKTKRDMQRIAKFRKRERELKFDIDLVKVDFPIQKKLEVVD